MAAAALAPAACTGDSSRVAEPTTATTERRPTTTPPGTNQETAPPRTTEAGPPPTGPACPPAPGGRIAYEQGIVGGGDGGADAWTVHVVRPDGTDASVLVRGGFDEIGEPSWSPDGTRVALSGVAAGDTRPTLIVLRCDGTTETTMANLEMQTASPFPVPIEEPSYPAWSPDGRTIAFLSADGIYLVDPANAESPRHIENPLTATRGRVGWSPDGTRLVFGATDDQDNTDIYVVGINGTGLRRLTTDPADDYQPAWSPDGRTISFRSTRDEQVWLMATDGSDQRSLTKTAAAAYQPAWSPDGTQLAYVADKRPPSSPRRRDTRIHVIAVNGTGDHQLTGDHPSPRVEGWPSWSGT